MKILRQFLKSSPRGAQAVLARMLDVSDSTVLRWANGTLRIDPGTAARIRSVMAIERDVQDYISTLRKGR